MSGKASRARRVESVRRAREDAARGVRTEWPDPRQARIYASAYAHAEQMLREVASVRAAYGLDDSCPDA